MGGVKVYVKRGAEMEVAAAVGNNLHCAAQDKDRSDTFSQLATIRERSQGWAWGDVVVGCDYEVT